MSMDSLGKMNQNLLSVDNLIINSDDLLKLPANSGYASYLLNLLSTCTLPYYEVRELEGLVLDGEIRMDELDALIVYLKDAQPDKIDAGMPYGQKEIHKKLDRMEGKI